MKCTLSWVHFREMHMPWVHFREMHMPWVHFHEMHMPWVHFREMHIVAALCVPNMPQCSNSGLAS